MAEGPNGKRLFIEGGSLDSLLGLISGLTHAQSSLIVQPRTGEWAQVTGRVINVSFNSDNVAVSIHLEGRHDVFMIFEKRSIEAMVLCKNDEITVQGQIAAHMGGVSLTKCEIISHVPGLELLVREMTAMAAAEPKLGMAVGEADGATDDPVKPSPLSGAEMRRFAELYLGIWQGGAVESKALEAIRATYPEHSAGRDPFYKIFRELRGPGKRGNPAFRG